MRTHAKKVWLYLKKTGIEFFQAEPMNYAALIAFYTIFSLPGILIILINIAGSVFGEDAVRGEVAKQIEEALGEQSAHQVQSVIENAIQSEGTTFATIVGVTVLAFSATTVFIAMQNAINHLWHIKPKPEKGLIKHIIDRILSFSMVVSLGFLLLASLVINVFVVALNDYLRTLLEDVTVYIVTVLNILISLGVNMSIFALTYKVLPDARIKWKDVFVGAFITTLLFLLGQFLIGIYLSEQDLDTTYGAAGALVLLLLWVYFASVALLLGAQFTYTYARDFGGGIEPTERAMEVEIREVEKKQGKKKN